MNQKVSQALKNYSAGYACSQAVLCAYADTIGLDPEMAYRMIEGFGGGFGGLQEVCGAFSAVAAILSYHCSDGNLQGGKSKRDTYEKIRQAAKLFEQECGSIVCRDILNREGPKPRKCGKQVRVAAEIIEKMGKEDPLSPQ